MCFDRSALLQCVKTEGFFKFPRENIEIFPVLKTIYYSFVHLAFFQKMLNPFVIHHAIMDVI